MKTSKPTKAQKIAFVKEIASDRGIVLTDAEAKKALSICGYDYYNLKEYFCN